MARSMITTVEKVFERLSDEARKFEFWESNNLELERHLDAPESNDILLFIKNAKIINYKNNNEIFCVEYEDNIYFIYAEEESDKLLEEFDFLISEEKFKNSLGLLAVTEGFLDITASAGRIFNEVIGCEPAEGMKTINFNETNILNLFKKFSTYKIDNRLYNIKFAEDLMRLELLLKNHNKKEQNQILKEQLNAILLLKSSNCVVDTIEYIIISEILDHVYLEIYHIIEYLFTLQHIISAIDKYEFDTKSFSEFFTNSGFRGVERTDIGKIVSNAREAVILECVEEDETIEKQDGNLKKKTQKLSEQIYMERCKIAHSKYGTPRVSDKSSSVKYIEMIIKVANSIYSNLDQSIVGFMEELELWTEISQ